MPNGAQSEAAAGAPKHTLVFEDVSVGFDGSPVLEEVSFTLDRGETKILLGVSGSGKTLILKLALGLLKPDSGKIYVLNREITQMKEDDLFDLRRMIGMVFQEGALFDSLTVEENVAYRLYEEHIDQAEILRRVVEALRFVELEETLDLYPSELSGGMRRRVAIARAIIAEPHVLFYDSPTGGLDPVTCTTIIELIVKERDVYKSPSILVTHRLQDAFALCTHRFDEQLGRMVPLPAGQTDPNTTFLMLEEGRIIFDGTLDELVESRNPFVREFLE